MQGKKCCTILTNLLITGRLYIELEPYLVVAQSSGRRIRFRHEAEVTPEDMAWADAFIGFRPVAGFRAADYVWVHSLGAGVERFVEEFQRQQSGTLLTRTITSFGQQIGEYCIGHMLRVSQKHDTYRALQHAREWKPSVAPDALRGRKAVLFGTGEIGTKLAGLCAAFGMQVIGVSRTGGAMSGFHRVYRIEEWKEALAGADYVVNTMPLTKETDRFFGDDVFAAMNKVMFLNVGRGASVDPAALLRAIRTGAVTNAVLDVFEEEPLPPDHPFWSHPDVVITPHISALTRPEEAAACLIETLRRLEAGEPVPNQVDVSRGY